MKTVFLIYPGTWLASQSQDEVSSLLRAIDEQVKDAIVALHLFERCRLEMSVSHARSDKPPWQQLNDLKTRKLEELSTNVVLPGQALPNIPGISRSFFLPPEVRSKLDLEAELAAKRELWQSSEMPSEFSGRLIWIYARTFLYAFDTIGKTLAVLAKTPGVAAGVEAARSDYYALFPDLTEIRNSSHHVEDRARGLGKYGMPLPSPTLSSYPPNLFKLGPNAKVGRLNMQNSLDGNRFGCTLFDGKYGQVEVSLVSLENASKCIQKAIDAFTWTGQARVVP